MRPMAKRAPRRPSRRIEILDTTLRDGEQAEGVSIMPAEKLMIARRLLEQVKVDRIEVASARVSEGERGAVGRIIEWADGAGLADRIEVLGFVDAAQSVDWTRSVGARVINLLTKGSLRHCREQLRRTPAQHLDDIRRTVDYGVSQGITFNVYLEDWSSGMIDSPDYVMAHIEGLDQMPVRRIIVCDTLGILSPWQASDFVGRLVSAFPGSPFRLPRSQRLWPRHGQLARSRAGRRTRRARDRQRHGRAGRQHVARRSGRGAARSRRARDTASANEPSPASASSSPSSRAAASP